MFVAGRFLVFTQWLLAVYTTDHRERKTCLHKYYDGTKVLTGLGVELAPPWVEGVRHLIEGVTQACRKKILIDNYL